MLRHSSESVSDSSEYSPSSSPTLKTTTPALRPPPWGLPWRSSKLFIITVVGMGIFTDLFIYSIIVPVLPHVLRDRLHIPDEKLQIYVSALLGAMAASSVVFSPVAGLIADRIGNRQKPFLGGLVALGLSTVLLALGNSVGMMALARVLQGLSSAVVWVVGLAICLETVGPSRLGTTFGTIFSCVGFGTQAAPVLGGVLYAKTGYGSVFALCFALIILDILLRLLMIERKTAAQYDQPAATLSPSPTEPSESSPLLGDTTASHELAAYKLPEPSTWLTRKLPILCTLRSPALLTAIFIGFVQSLLLGCFDATIPTIALEYYNFNALQSGLLFLALGLPSLMLGPLFGYLVDRFGARFVAVFGYGYLVPVHILLRIPQRGGSEQVRVFASILAFMSVGMSAIDAPSLVEAGTVIERYHKANPEFFGETGPYAQLYGLNSMVFSLGFTVGPLIAGVLKDTIGYGNMNAVVAGICAISAAMSFFFLGARPRGKNVEG